MRFGGRLRQLRLDAGWTQAELAKRAGLPEGSGQATVNALETRNSKGSAYAGAFARALGVRLEWLLYEEGQKDIDPTEEQPWLDAGQETGGSGGFVQFPFDQTGTDSQGFRLARTARLLPLLTMIGAGKLCTRDETLTEEDAKDYLPSPYPAQAGDYLLTVDGPSMYKPDGTGYSDGDILHIRRCGVAVSGQDVIARTPEGRMTFKRFIESQDGNYLEALNPSWPERIIRVPDGTTICGYVVGSGSWKKRG